MTGWLWLAPKKHRPSVSNELMGQPLRCGGREGLSFSSVVMFLKTNRFIDEPQYKQSFHVPLPYTTDNTGEIIQANISRT